MSGCFGTPQGLPVSLSICSAVPRDGGLEIHAAVRSQATKPISRIDVVASFYQAFRYRSISATAFLQRELDPGESRPVTFMVFHPARDIERGQAIRCYATHLQYLDNTSDDAPAVR